MKLLDAFRNDCQQFLLSQVKELTHITPDFNSTNLSVERIDGKFGIKPFFIDLGSESHEETDFAFNAPTTIYNTLRLLRGIQLNKAILLEGSPGVGKTSLVVALAKSTGHKIFRVNLSDQTVNFVMKNTYFSLFLIIYFVPVVIQVLVESMFFLFVGHFRSFRCRSAGGRRDWRSVLLEGRSPSSGVKRWQLDPTR